MDLPKPTRRQFLKAVLGATAGIYVPALILPSTKPIVVPSAQTVVDINRYSHYPNLRDVTISTELGLIDLANYRSFGEAAYIEKRPDSNFLFLGDLLIWASPPGPIRPEVNGTVIRLLRDRTFQVPSIT